MAQGAGNYQGKWKYAASLLQNWDFAVKSFLKLYTSVLAKGRTSCARHMLLCPTKSRLCRGCQPCAVIMQRKPCLVWVQGCAAGGKNTITNPTDLTQSCVCHSTSSQCLWCGPGALIDQGTNLREEKAAGDAEKGIFKLCQRVPVAVQTLTLESGAPDKSLLSKRSQSIISQRQKKIIHHQSLDGSRNLGPFFSWQTVFSTGWEIWIMLQMWGFCSPSENFCQFFFSCIYLVLWGKSPCQCPISHLFLGTPWEAFHPCYKAGDDSA